MAKIFIDELGLMLKLENYDCCTIAINSMNYWLELQVLGNITAHVCVQIRIHLHENNAFLQKRYNCILFKSQLILSRINGLIVGSV